LEEAMLMNKNDILKAYNFRHACKEFDPARKIPDEDFAFLLEIVRLSPSSFGLEPWRLVVLQSPVLREKLLRDTWGAQKTLPTASHFVLFFARNKDQMMPDSAYIHHIMRDVQKLPDDVAKARREKYLNFLTNDFQLLQRDGAVEAWTDRQVYIALGNMLTAAALLGIDSCPVEGFAAEKLAGVLSEEGIDDGVKFHLCCMAAFGYRVKDPRPKTRRVAAEIIEWK
jgi:nitroreductase